MWSELFSFSVVSSLGEDYLIKKHISAKLDGEQESDWDYFPELVFGEVSIVDPWWSSSVASFGGHILCTAEVFQALRLNLANEDKLSGALYGIFVLSTSFLLVCILFWSCQMIRYVIYGRYYQCYCIFWS